MPPETVNKVKSTAPVPLTELDNYAELAVRSTSGVGIDPRIVADGLLKLWPRVRPANGKAITLAEGVLGSARLASLESLRAPPYPLLQAYAVAWQVANRPLVAKAAEDALRDPVATIGRLVDPTDQKRLAALYRSPRDQRRAAGLLAGITGSVGLALGVVLGRVSKRGATP